MTTTESEVDVFIDSYSKYFGALEGGYTYAVLLDMASVIVHNYVL